MAGKMCPNCGEMTFHLSPKGRKCSRCDYEMIVRPNNGKGGRGSQCSNCNEFKVRPLPSNPNKSRCNGCGATYQ